MPQSTWSVVPYFLGIIAISVILMPLFNVTRGSLLISILFHFQMMNPIFPDAQPWDNLLWIAVAVVVVWLNRHTMLQRGAGVTDVLMPTNSETARSNIYEIRVRGFLDPQWDWLTGLTVTHTETGETILSGPIVDQAALHGLLARIRDLNLTLLSVELVAPNDFGKEGQNG